MKIIKFEDINEIEEQIWDCKRKKHIQQVAYSVHHEGLTQICFTCKKVNTNINIEELR